MSDRLTELTEAGNALAATLAEVKRLKVGGVRRSLSDGRYWCRGCQGTADAPEGVRHAAGCLVVRIERDLCRWAALLAAEGEGPAR
jgi:hypothetical protein